MATCASHEQSKSGGLYLILRVIQTKHYLMEFDWPLPQALQTIEKHKLQSIFIK